LLLPSIAGLTRDTVQRGAKALIEESSFSKAKEGTTYVAPQVLINVDHGMRVMTEETLCVPTSGSLDGWGLCAHSGPVVGVMKVG
jgi:hypothetical protein